MLDSPANNHAYALVRHGAISAAAGQTPVIGNGTTSLHDGDSNAPVAAMTVFPTNMRISAAAETGPKAMHDVVPAADSAAAAQREVASIATADLRGEFLAACASGQLQLVRALLALTGDRCVDVQVMGEEAFRHACANGHLGVVRELLALSGRRRVDVHVWTEYPFRNACEYGHLGVVRELLALTGDCRVDVHTVDEYALRLACDAGHLGMVRELLALSGDRRVDVHAQDEGAFHVACEKGHLNVVRELLALAGDRCVDVNSRRDDPLQWACQNGHVNVVHELLALMGDRRVRLQHGNLPEAGRDMLASGLGDPNSPTVAAAWRAISSPDGMMMHPGVEYHTRESARAGYRVYKWCVRGVVVLRRQEGQRAAAWVRLSSSLPHATVAATVPSGVAASKLVEALRFCSLPGKP